MKHVRLSLVAILAMINVVVLAADAKQPRSGSQAEVVAAAFTAEVTGTVKRVNSKSGKLVLETVNGPVNVRFPAEAVQGIKPGDQAPTPDAFDAAPKGAAGPQLSGPFGRGRLSSPRDPRSSAAWLMRDGSSGR